MKKLLIAFLPALLFTVNAAASPFIFPDRYLLKCGDFVITKITADKSQAQFGLRVSIYFKQSRSIMLPYPCLQAVTNLEGDTLGTGFPEYFCHNGQDTVDYHITLRKNEIPQYENCLFSFTGPSANQEEKDECKLTYRSNPALPSPEPCALDGSKLKITGVKVYNPEGILPELEVSICFDAPRNQVLPLPYLKSITGRDGKILGDGYKSLKEYSGHQGKDTLVYHLYLRHNKIPDLSECEFYFCSTDKSGKETMCRLKYGDQSSALVPQKQKSGKQKSGPKKKSPAGHKP